MEDYASPSMLGWATTLAADLPTLLSMSVDLVYRVYYEYASSHHLVLLPPRHLPPKHIHYLPGLRR